MSKRKRAVTRRELLELVAATGVLTVFSTAAVSASAAEGTTPVPVGDDADLIGALLWAAFAEGAKIESIPDEVYKKGHELSSGPIHNHLQQGLENFPLDATVRCARAAGEKARELAGSAAPVTAQNFDKAWHYIQHRQQTAMSRLANKQGTKGSVRMLGGAC